jgi:hypothetical protein
MRLGRFGRDVWDVLAFYDDRGQHCQVFDFLNDLKGDYAASGRALRAALRETIPVHGPTRVRSWSRPLGDALFELVRENSGRRVRVIYFYEPGRVVICTSGFTKDRKAPPEEIEKAKVLRQRFRDAVGTGDIRDAVRRGAIQISPLPR